MTKKKKIIIVISSIVALSVCIIVGFIIFANWKIETDTAEFIFEDINKVPAQKAALVLGTTQFTPRGENAYFRNRINAAAELYKVGKVSKFVLSGDNSKADYNEPEDMRVELIKAGVPDSIIYLDYAGFRTLDSVVRMKKIFGQDSFVIVSQAFHNQRAIYLAHHYGLNAIGYNAIDIEFNKYSVKTKVREKIARAKVFIDLFFGKTPKFLGEAINID